MNRANQNVNAAPMPTSLPQYLLAVAKNLVKNWWKVLIPPVVFGLAGFVYHTYLLVGPNEGFLKNNLANSEYFLNFVEEMNRRIPTMTVFTGRFIWFLVPLIIMGLFHQIKDQRLEFLKLRGRYFAGIFKNSVKGKPVYLTALLAGALTAMTLTLISQNPYFCILLGVAIFIGISAEDRCDLFFITALIFKKGNPQAFDYSPISGALTGAWFGFLVNGILQMQDYGSIAQYISLAVIATLFIVRVAGIFLNKPTGKTMMLILFAGGLAPVLVIAAQAHDGGWAEAGSTWNGWWNSYGRDIAMDLGRVPGYMAAAGAFLAEIFLPRGAAAATLDHSINFTDELKGTLTGTAEKPKLGLEYAPGKNFKVGANASPDGFKIKEWGLSSQGKYKGFTLGGSGSFTYSDFTGGNANLGWKGKGIDLGARGSIDGRGNITGSGLNLGWSGQGFKVGGTGSFDGGGYFTGGGFNAGYSGQGFTIGGTGSFGGSGQFTGGTANLGYKGQGINFGGTGSFNGSGQITNIGANLGYGVGNLNIGANVSHSPTKGTGGGVSANYKLQF